jgi:hypothetical protein
MPPSSSRLDMKQEKGGVGDQGNDGLVRGVVDVSEEPARLKLRYCSSQKVRDRRREDTDVRMPWTLGSPLSPCLVSTLLE